MRTYEDNPGDWYLFADERLRVADAAAQSAPEPCLTCIELLQEAAERYLKGYLISRGWELVRSHNLRFLIDEAVTFDPRFAEFREWAAELTVQYFAQHYLGGDISNVGYNYGELRAQLNELLKLIPR